ncbi:calponin (CH) domain-containing protein [Tieghemostelium lacteum]|uniref:Calponin (CH) domain-containing protein n=1 Tax=Tieghemostelium lacteum TaxID=361077 RepID=A0A151Z3U6_TIELA|nr:calponin (CH) domain-containing protein [Tieghemostelium lacteum]|eukprot:KYQ88474.1 calponin (CH) domain-containing protein [Tieghemostelium lacteum]
MYNRISNTNNLINKFNTINEQKQQLIPKQQNQQNYYNINNNKYNDNDNDDDDDNDDYESDEYDYDEYDNVDVYDNSIMEPPTTVEINAPKISKKGDEITLISANAGEEGSVHTFSEEEKVAYSKFINERLDDQEQLKPTYIEIDPSTNQLFNNCKDGVLLNKLMESLFPKEVELKGLVIKKNINPFEAIQNQNIVIKNALKVGCIIVNIGAQDLIDAKEYLVLGIIWQIIKSGLLSKVNQNANDMMEVLFEKEEEDNSASTTPTTTEEKKDEHSAEEILMRWVNFHLEKANCHRTLKNFSEDVQDSMVYANLLHQLLPNVLDDIVERATKEANLFARAEIITQACEKMGVKCFLSPSDIALGHPKLNLALVALLFNSEASIKDMRREREEKIERERVERERVERERKEKEVVERERVERERIERDRAEQHRLEQERLQREKEEQEKLERERIELERIERERIERDKEAERLERERIEREIIERELREKEQAEKERLERERIEREIREKEQAEKDRLEKERLDNERSEADRLENLKEYRIATRIQKRMVDDPSLTDNMQKLVGEITELKRNIVGELRNIRSLQFELSKSTKNIDRVLENKKEGKKLKKQKKIKPVKGVPNGLDTTKMKNYQQLFYFIQNQPQVMGKLLFLLQQDQVNKTFHNLLLSLFPYEISPREEDLFLKAISVALEYQIRHTNNITELFSEKSVPMIVLQDYFQKKGLKYLREQITPIILKVLDNKDLNLNIDPFWIEKQLKIDKEIKEGKKQEKSKEDMTFDQVMQNSEVASLYESRTQQLVEIGLDFYDRILKTIEELPVQLRYLCKVLAEKSRVGFKQQSPVTDQDTYVTYYMIIYRLIGSIISSPDSLNELVLQAHPYIPKQSRYNLSMISRFLQAVFTNKPWLHPFPTPKIQIAINEHGKNAQLYLKKVCQVPDLDELIHYRDYNQIMKENNITFCTVINLTEIIWLHETVLDLYYDLIDIGLTKDYENSLEKLTINSKTVSEKRRYQTTKRTTNATHNGLDVNGSISQMSDSENNWWLKNLLDLIDQPLQLPEQGDRGIQLTFLYNGAQEKQMDLFKEAKIWMIEILNKSQPPKKDQNTIEILKDAEAFFKSGNSGAENMTLISKASQLITRLKEFPSEMVCSKPEIYDLFLIEVEKELESILRKNKLMRSELTRLHTLLKTIRIDGSPLPSLCKFQADQLQKAIEKKKYKQKQFELNMKSQDKTTHKFSLAELIKKGMIVSCDLHEASHSKVTIIIKMVGPGLFDIDAKLAMVSKTVQLELDSLLDYSKNHITEYQLEGIVLDVNMTIHTLIKLFNI